MRNALASLLGCVLAVGLSIPASASSLPMRLDDSTPRWVAVEFEISPPERPGQQDVVYTHKLPGWLEPDDTPGRVRVTTPGWAVERGLMVGEKPVSGSFSDFVWIFEARTGRVVEASVSGSVLRELELGFFTREIETRIEVRMSSESRAGYRPPTHVLGQCVIPHCDDPTSGCTLVDGRPYDPDTGLVNAVGGISATAAGVRVVSFSPLGEARFSEVDGAPWLRVAQSSGSGLAQ